MNIKLFLICTLLKMGSMAVLAKGHLKISILQRPTMCNSVAKIGNILFVHYKGFFKNGTMFVSSYGKEHAEHVPLGSGHFIKGFEDGLVGMCVGEKRKLVIPPNLGYGDVDKTIHNGVVIPANSELTFEVELLLVQEIDHLKRAFDLLDKNQDGFIEPKEIKQQIETVAKIPKERIHKGLVPELKMDQIYDVVFAQLDTDQDGLISSQEYLQALPDHLSDEL